MRVDCPRPRPVGYGENAHVLPVNSCLDDICIIAEIINDYRENAPDFLGDHLQAVSGR